MEKLLNAYALAPNLVAARRIVRYENKHPFAVCFLNPEQIELLNAAKQLVREA